MLKEAIDSILNQTFKHFELIIVDNFSSDSTELVIKSYNDKRIRYFKNENHGLIGINRNYGIRKSQCEYIAFLDDDDLWLSEKLEKQFELLDSNKELALVYSDSYMIDSNGNLKNTIYSYSSLKPFRGNVFNELLFTNFIPNLTVMIRKDVLNEVGLFDPKYRIALDYDLWLKIAECYPIDFIEQPLAKYRIHGERLSRNSELSLVEELQIMEYWLNKKPDLKRELRGKLKLKRKRLYCKLAIQHLKKCEIKETVRDFIRLVKNTFL